MRTLTAEFSLSLSLSPGFYVACSHRTKKVRVKKLIKLGEHENCNQNKWRHWNWISFCKYFSLDESRRGHRQKVSAVVGEESMRKFMNYLQMQPSRIFFCFFSIETILLNDGMRFLRRKHVKQHDTIEMSSNVEKGRKLFTICYLLFATYLVRDHFKRLIVASKKIFHQVHLSSRILDRGNEIITNSCFPRW